MDCVQSGCSGMQLVTREALYLLMKKCPSREFSKKLNFMENEIISKPTFPEEQKNDFLRKLSYVKSEMKAKWLASNRTERTFLTKNHDWLQITLEIPIKKIEKVGRPMKPFDDLSDRSKRRKTQHLRETIEAEELLYASQMKLRESGNVQAARVLKDMARSPSKAATCCKALKSSSTVPRLQLTPTQALSMFVEACLTRKQYDIIRASDKSLYPCYSVLQRAKKECYPNQEAYRVTETCAEVQLQHLLNHTTQRLLLYLDEVMKNLSVEESSLLELICKWGCDGSQQTQYKQTFNNSSDTDANIFQSSLVSLRLLCRSNNRVIWQNPFPSSPRYCRPMRIRFIHETTDITNEEINYHNQQIRQLKETKISRPEGEVSIKHTMLLTMVDGKVCNAATQTTSTMRCFICKATSKEFNDLSKTKNVVPENLKFGLSVLHARIRFFESLLHLSYKITIMKWQIRTPAEKKIVQERKKIIQENFKTKLGLIVDVPKPGYGSSNDGNTSRRFFANAEVSSEITGIDLHLIKRFAIILEVISSGHRINVEKFEKYCLDSAELYVKLYSWHPMAPTIHKILIHGPLVVQHALLPIGSLSEEAAEARNKHFRMYRQNFSTKFSREECNFDILNRLLLTSDPYISSVRPRPKKKTLPFSTEALAMLLPSETVEIERDIHHQLNIPSESNIISDTSDKEN